MALGVLGESWRQQAGFPSGSRAPVTHHERKVSVGFCCLFSTLLEF